MTDRTTIEIGVTYGRNSQSVTIDSAGNVSTSRGTSLEYGFISTTHERDDLTGESKGDIKVMAPYPVGPGVYVGPEAGVNEKGQPLFGAGAKTPLGGASVTVTPEARCDKREGTV